MYQRHGTNVNSRDADSESGEEPPDLKEFLDRRITDGVIIYHPLSISETVNGGTVCRKTARTDLWGSGEVTIRSTRTLGS